MKMEPDIMRQDLQYMFLWTVIKEINRVLSELNVNPLVFRRKAVYLNQIKSSVAIT
ncbi:MAG: hypothetical protein ACXADY_25415 [Candidatus Hodarchaeales archaeon]